MSNYTDSMISEIRANAPLNLEKAHALADKFGATISYRSVISKAKSLGVDYEKKAPAAKKSKASEPTKADLLAEIRRSAALPEREGDLVKNELLAIMALIP